MRPGVLAFLVLVTGCPTVDHGAAPVAPGACLPDMGEFQMPGGIWDTAVAPATTASCVQAGGCHRREDGRSALRLLTKNRDEYTQAEWRQNYEVVGRFLNCSTPAASSFITKPKSG